MACREAEPGLVSWSVLGLSGSEGMISQSWTNPRHANGAQDIPRLEDSEDLRDPTFISILFVNICTVYVYSRLPMFTPYFREQFLLARPSKWIISFTAEDGSYPSQPWFGHRTGWSPFAHSIGKFFLWFKVCFPFETSVPVLPGNYLYMNFLLGQFGHFGPTVYMARKDTT